MSIWDMGHRFGIRCIDMVIYHIDMVILDIDMGDEADDMADDSIDTVISHIDMGYLVTLCTTLFGGAGDGPAGRGVHSPTSQLNLSRLVSEPFYVQFVTSYEIMTHLSTEGTQH